MHISTKGRYALRMMIDLAQHQTAEENVPLKKIAERQQISVKYLEQIITALSRAGYVKSLRGSQGGYRLAYPPEHYTVGMILRLTEGTLSPVACLDNEVNECPRQEICPTLFVWQKLYDAINETVDSITLQDILDNQAANSPANDYVI